jgi:hypothetical protein
MIKANGGFSNSHVVYTCILAHHSYQPTSRRQYLLLVIRLFPRFAESPHFLQTEARWCDETGPSVVGHVE